MDPYMKDRWEQFKNEMNKEYQMIQQIASHLNNLNKDGGLVSSGVS